MFVLALLLLGGGLAWEWQRGTPSSLPAGVSQTALSRAVTNAIKTEKSGGRLRNFANAVAPYSATFAAQLNAQAQALAAQARASQNLPLIQQVPASAQALRTNVPSSSFTANSPIGHR